MTEQDDIVRAINFLRSGEFASPYSTEDYVFIEGRLDVTRVDPTAEFPISFLGPTGLYSIRRLETYVYQVELGYPAAMPQNRFPIAEPVYLDTVLNLHLAEQWHTWGNKGVGALLRGEDLRAVFFGDRMNPTK